LRQHGCDQVQGNLFSQPLPAAAFVDWYRNWTMRPVSLA
jgi:EAL domain-containing protein (putative c-di-GMP-specific phosphodiesterase class I)